MGIKKIFQFILVGALSGCVLLEPPPKKEEKVEEVRRISYEDDCGVPCQVRSLIEAAEGLRRSSPNKKPPMRRRKAPQQRSVAERNRQAAAGGGWQKLSNGNCRLGKVEIVRGGSNISANGKRFNCR